MELHEFKEMCRYLSKKDKQILDRWDEWWKNLSPRMQKQFDEAMKEYVRDKYVRDNSPA